MTDLVPPEDIERLVGATRRRHSHVARLVPRCCVYILHSAACRDLGIDLRECRFSKALDRGIHRRSWQGFEDRPVLVAVAQGLLVPIAALTEPGLSVSDDDE